MCTGRLDELPYAAPIAGGMNLARDTLGAAAAATPSRPALTFVQPDGDRTWTYGELWSIVERVGRGLLARGLVPGDRVLLRLPHSPEYVFAFFGATLAGLLPVPSSPLLTAEEAQFLAFDAEPAAVIEAPEMALHAFGGIRISMADLETIDGPRPLPETLAEDAAYIIYTSGTSAHPKGVLHAHRSLLARRLMVREWQGVTPGDRVMHAGLLNWSYTLGVGLTDAWLAGAHTHLYGGPHDPRRWPELLRRYDITVFAAVPTVYRQILKYAPSGPISLPSLRHGLTAGEALTPAVLDEWRARARTELYEALGMTEIGTYISSGAGVPVRPGAAGKPQSLRRICILPDDGGNQPLPPGEVGLLAVHRSDPGLMLGYWRRPDEERTVYRGEWFVGGDRASIDEDGYVWFHGRADDVIKSFGHRVSPADVEAAFAGCPGITDVAVVGVPLSPEKTLIAACIVAEDGVSVEEADLHARARERLAEYKRPHLYVRLEGLPRTANGKLRRSELAQLLRERLAADAGA